MIRLAFFKTVMNVISTTPTNFTEMSDALKEIKDDLVGSLLHILASLQFKAPLFYFFYHFIIMRHLQKTWLSKLWHLIYKKKKIHGATPSFC